MHKRRLWWLGYPVMTFALIMELLIALKYYPERSVDLLSINAFEDYVYATYVISTVIFVAGVIYASAMYHYIKKDIKEGIEHNYIFLWGVIIGAYLFGLVIYKGVRIDQAFWDAQYSIAELQEDSLLGHGFPVFTMMGGICAAIPEAVNMILCICFQIGYKRAEKKYKKPPVTEA